LARNGNNQKLLVGNSVIEQHGVGVKRGLDFLEAGRLWVEQAGVGGKLLAQLPIQLALAVGKFAALMACRRWTASCVVGVGLALLAGEQQQLLALELLLLGDEVFQGFGSVGGDGQSARVNISSARVRARLRSSARAACWGSLLVEGELGLEGVGVEVLFGEGGFGFGVLDGVALGFVYFESACEVPLGLGVVFLTRARMAKFWSVRATCSELGASFSSIANAC
jgi:hypothetical protein